MFFTPAPLLRAVRYPSLMESLTTLGLTTNLRLVLDAGDVDSFPGGQKWLDRSGGGYDFHLGADATVSATDPTFNGNYGNQYQEYLSSDGGDYFSYDAADEAWMKALHKAGSITMLAIVYIASDNDCILFSNAADWEATGAPVGVSFGFASTWGGNSRRFQVVRPTTVGTLSGSISGATLTVPNLFIASMSIVYNSDGSEVRHVNINGAATTSTPGADPNFKPVTTDPAHPTKLFAFGGAGNPAPSGSRLYGKAVWQGTALSAANLASIWTTIRGRYGL